MKKDLRFQKTEYLLKEAIFELLREKSYKQISVTDICKKAMCSRNAFYQHYESKEHLIESIINSIISDVLAGCAPTVTSIHEVNQETIRHYTDNILSAVYERKDDIRLLLDINHLYFCSKLKKSIIENNLSLYSKCVATPEEELVNLYWVYISSGIIGFIEYWLVNSHLTITEAQNMLGRITMNSILDVTNISLLTKKDAVVLK
ncbi:TetR/AcrR family transcriptional regulator [Terrisporobacter sp.]